MESKERAPSDLHFKLTAQVLSLSHTRRDGKTCRKKKEEKKDLKQRRKKKSTSGRKTNLGIKICLGLLPLNVPVRSSESA